MPLILLILFACTLIGCYGESAKERLPAIDDKKSSLIQAFSVAGKSSDTKSVVTIDAYSNSRSFDLTWQLLTVNARGEIYLSYNDQFESSLDLFILSNCDVFPSCSSQKNFSTQCTYSTQNRLICDSNNQLALVLDNFITELPMQVYFILRACDSDSKQCQTSAIAVEFR